jgi:hypothetical protein
MSREEFAKIYQDGGLQKLNELVEIFSRDPDSGLKVKDDPKTVLARQKAMLELFEDGG